MDANSDQATYQQVCEWLSRPATHGLESSACVRCIQTHAARVYLAGDWAYKLKRPVKYDYLDFSTPALRRAMLERELRVNQPWAPGVYDQVVAITRNREAGFAFGGTGEPVEWALRMHRFADGATLDQYARQGQFTEEMARRLGADLSCWHDRLAPVEPARAPDLSPVIDDLCRGLQRVATQLQDTRQSLVSPSLATLPGLIESAIRRLAGWRQRHERLLHVRAAEGWIRRCHGDLHLGNLIWADGMPMAFDALEFDESLATTDVLYDLAFLLMDLRHAGLSLQANRVFNHYVDNRVDESFYRGLKLLPGYMAMRALVRALVTAQRAEADSDPGARRSAWTEALNYVTEALALLQPLPPVLVAIGGLSGTGKSTVAAALTPLLDPAPGGLQLRTDVIRKALWDRTETERLPAAAYTAEASQAVYERLWQLAEMALGGGCSVVLDAVHLRQDERRAAVALARRLGLGFVGAWLEASHDTLLRRVAQRRGDASDADASVVEAQAGYDAGRIDWPRYLSERARASALARQIAIRARTLQSLRLAEAR